MIRAIISSGLIVASAGLLGTGILGIALACRIYP